MKPGTAGMNAGLNHPASARDPDAALLARPLIAPAALVERGYRGASWSEQPPIEGKGSLGPDRYPGRVGVVRVDDDVQVAPASHD